jgi:hypothetical protein
VDYLAEMRCEKNLREAYTLGQHVVETYNRYLERGGESVLSPFWELRVIERVTLALYLERASAEKLNANHLLSYTTGSKLLEAADSLRERSLISSAVEDLLSPLRAEDESRVNFRATALAYKALSVLEEKSFDAPRNLGNWS